MGMQTYVSPVFGEVFQTHQTNFFDVNTLVGGLIKDLTSWFYKPETYCFTGNVPECWIATDICQPLLGLLV
jgi:hypothetical protein